MRVRPRGEKDSGDATSSSGKRTGWSSFRMMWAACVAEMPFASITSRIRRSNFSPSRRALIPIE